MNDGPSAVGYSVTSLVLQRDFKPEFIQASQPSVAMRAVGSRLATLLVVEQCQCGSPVEYGLGQNRPE